MTNKDFFANLPSELKNLIGKKIQKTLPNGKTIHFILGDITGDGKVDDEDIQILRLLSEGGHTAETLLEHMTDEQLAACDITGDGMITKEDLIQLVTKLVFSSGKKNDKLSNLRDRMKK